jgi:hypothetical protein
VHLGGIPRVHEPPGCIEAQWRYGAIMKKRPDGTTHLSISLPTEEARILERRAKRVYDGNVSRVVSEAIRYVSAEAALLDAAWGLVATKSA